jgi:4-hydroxybenzoate polyprenyltransferase
MDKLISHLASILSPDWATLAVVALLCAIAAYVLKEYLAHPPMIIFVYPVMIFCSLAAYYLFVATEQLNPKKIDQWLMWTILASICGTAIGTVALSLLAVLRERLGGPRRPPQAPSRPTRAAR